jgi:CheY-like chemotaxis protein
MADERIVVVDDEKEMRALLGRVLSDAGYSVETFGGATEALRAIQKRAPALVLVDLDLPDGASRAFLAGLGELDPQPPALGLGALDALSAVLQGPESGIAGFVARPVHAGDLLQTCRRVIHASGRGPAPSSDRRRQQRHTLRLTLDLLSASGEPLAVGELVDLSEGGVSLRVPVPFEVGQRLQVAVAAPGAPEGGIELQGDVRWCTRDDGDYVHGLQFVDLSKPTQDWLDQYCKSSR